MSSSFRGERGGLTAVRATSALKPTHDASHLQSSQSSDRLHRHNPTPVASSMRNITRVQKDAGPSNEQSAADQSPPAMNFPSPNTVAQSDLLQDTVFPAWKDDAGPENLDSAEELQKQDPLGTQIWKLYSKTKTRLPNQERMENLTWRMMAMNLKRREREQALYAHRLRIHEQLTNSVTVRAARPSLSKHHPDPVVSPSSFETRSTSLQMHQSMP